MSNNKDFKVKNGIQPTSYFEGVGTVVSGSEGYALANASYDSVSFSVASQDAGPRAVAFKSDGTKMYYAGTNNDTIYQYSLSTAWDVSTASYDSVSFSVASQGQPSGLVFKSDGTKFYLSENNTSSVYQYSLSTAWDMSTASYDSVSFSISSQGLYPHDVMFKSDGTSMYVYASDVESVFQYTLSTAWDLSTASYASKSYAFANAEDTSPEGMDISADGTKFYMVGRTTDSIYQYTLSTADDISTVSYDSVSFSISSQDTDPYNIVFGNSGEKLYVVGNTNDSIYQYSTVLTTAELDLSTGSVFEVTPTSDIQVTLSNPADSGTVSGATLLLDGVGVTGYNLSNATYSGNSFSVSGQETVPSGVAFKSDGTKMYIVGSTGDDVNEYALSTAWDITTASYTTNFSVSSQHTTPMDIAFKTDGTEMYVVGSSADIVSQYTLSTAWDVSTASYTRQFSTSGQETIPQGLDFKPDGTIMYVSGLSADSVHEYSLSTAWDLSTASAVRSESVSTQTTSPAGVSLQSDGSAMFVLGRTDKTVYRYTLSTPWNLSTASYSNSYTLDALTNPSGITFKTGGTEMYIVDYDFDTVYQYNTATPATITYDTAIEWPSGTAPTSPAIGETDVVTFNTRDGGSTYQGVLAIDGAK